MKQKTVLMTGVAGFIGFHTAKKLLDENYKVIGVDSLNDYYDPLIKKKRLSLLKHKNFIFHKLDFTNLKKINTTLKGYTFSKIIHLGAQAGVRYSIENPFVYEQTNFLGTLNLLEFAKAKKIDQFILASTSSVYGKNEKRPFEESDVTDSAISTYAATKKACEILTHTYSHLFGINVTVLRFFTVYGPWGRPDMALFKFTKNILLGKQIDVYNNGDMQRSFTYIDDIVSGILGAVKKVEKYEIYNLGGGETVKLMNFISLIETYLDKKAKIKFLKMQAGDVKETVASTKKAARYLHYKANTDIQTGVQKFVQWFMENKSWLLVLKDGKQ
jgi:UDP-glucuronate 4-epimerase